MSEPMDFSFVPALADWALSPVAVGVRCAEKMMASADFTLVVDVGPVARAALDLADLADLAAELHALIPEWHAAERAELEQRLLLLGDTFRAALKGEGR